jgi:hypothetical protein
MQDVINDPIKLLQQVIERQVDQGHSFKGTVINISTQAKIAFFSQPNSMTSSPTVVVDLTDGPGSAEAICMVPGRGRPSSQKRPEQNDSLEIRANTDVFTP